MSLDFFCFFVFGLVLFKFVCLFGCCCCVCVFCTRFNWEWRKAKHQAMFVAKTKGTSKEATSRVMSVAEAKTHYAKFKEFRTWYQAKTGINLFDKRFVIGAVTFKTKVIMQSSFCV